MFVEHELRIPLKESKPLLENCSKEMTKEKKIQKKKRKIILGFLFWVVTFYRALGIVNMGSLHERTVGWIPKFCFPCCGCLFTWSFPVLKFSSCKNDQLPCACFVLCSGFVGCNGCPCRAGIFTDISTGEAGSAFQELRVRNRKKCGFCPLALLLQGSS